MISLIVTAWKEPGTIAKAVSNLLSQVREINDTCEFLLVCPDRETYEAASRVVSEYQKIDFIFIKDPQKGKPYALNMAFRKARGSVWVLSDGDVWIGEGALKELVRVFDDPSVGGATGRPLCRNSRDTIWGYWGHMFMDAAHEKRMQTLRNGGFYAMSGYLLAMRARKLTIPAGVLDDVYISCLLKEKGKNIVYVPTAYVHVSQPSNWNDWVSQKVRSMAGYQDIRKIFPQIEAFRTFSGDVAFAMFPLRYARSSKELFWSVLQYPMRLYIWISIYAQLLRGRTAADLWIGKRIESTK
jgi:poly-beta-1,6-N-acetyl-D-glucosamine synthase